VFVSSPFASGHTSSPIPARASDVTPPTRAKPSATANETRRKIRFVLKTLGEGSSHIGHCFREGDGDVSARRPV
jgi:hypothetical protein